MPGRTPTAFRSAGVSNPTFNGSSVTDSRTISGTPNAAGVLYGTVTLPTNGEGLTGESPINVPVNYSVQVFSGSGNWTGGSGSSWGANGNWTDSNGSGIQAAPGTWGFNERPPSAARARSRQST